MWRKYKFSSECSGSANKLKIGDNRMKKVYQTFLWPFVILWKIMGFKLINLFRYFLMFLLCGVLAWILNITWPNSLHYFLIAYLAGIVLGSPVMIEIFHSPGNIGLPRFLSIGLVGVMVGIWF